GLRNEFALAGPLVEAQRIIEQLTAALASPAARDSVAALSKEIGDLFRIVAQAVPGIIQSFADLLQALREHVGLIKIAVEAWIAYRASLITAAVIEGVIAAFQRLRAVLLAVGAAIEAMQAAQAIASARTAQVSVLLPALTAGFAALAGPAGWIPLVATALTAVAGGFAFFATRAALAKAELASLAEEAKSAGPVIQE